MSFIWEEDKENPHNNYTDGNTQIHPWWRESDGFPLSWWHKGSKCQSQEFPGLKHSTQSKNSCTGSNAATQSIGAPQSLVTAALPRLGKNCFHLACHFGHGHGGFPHLSESSSVHRALATNLEPLAIQDAHTFGIEPRSALVGEGLLHFHP